MGTKLLSVKKLQKNHKLPRSYLVILVYKWKQIFGWTVLLKSHFDFWCCSSRLVTADFEDDVIDKCKPTPAALALFFLAPQHFLPKTTWFSLWPPHPDDLAVRSRSTSEAFWCPISYTWVIDKKELWDLTMLNVSHLFHFDNNGIHAYGHPVWRRWMGLFTLLSQVWIY